MTLLGHCIYLFQKRLDILINMKKNQITMSVMVKDKQLLEITTKYGEKKLKN